MLVVVVWFVKVEDILMERVQVVFAFTIIAEVVVFGVVVLD